MSQTSSQAEAPPPQPAPPPAQKPQPQPQQNPIPHLTHQLSLRTPRQLTGRNLMTFGRLDSDYAIQDRVVQIANQNTLSGLVYDQLEQLVNVNLPITRDEFIRVYKTLLLKRVQDVYEKEKLVRPDHYVRIARNIQLPAPLAETLSAIGSFHSAADGMIYHAVQPARAANPENWWAVDNDLILNWSKAIGRLSHQYVMSEFPSFTDYADRPDRKSVV